jgi:hypothetical protein
MSMSDRLREARIAAGFVTASAAARSLGVPVPTYSHHENGGRPLGVEAGGFYASRFNVDPAWLLLGEHYPRDRRVHTSGAAR